MREERCGWERFICRVTFIRFETGKEKKRKEKEKKKDRKRELSFNKEVGKIYASAYCHQTEQVGIPRNNRWLLYGRSKDSLQCVLFIGC